MTVSPFDKVATPTPRSGISKRVRLTLAGLAVVLLLIVLLVWLNLSRERIKDEAVHANLQTVVTQASIFKSGLGSYGATGGNDCSRAMYADPTIQSALIAVRISNGYSEEYCTASEKSFLLVVGRPNRGFYKPDAPYWCADSAGDVCAISSLEEKDEGTCGCS